MIEVNIFKVNDKSYNREHYLEYKLYLLGLESFYDSTVEKIDRNYKDFKLLRKIHSRK